MAKKKAEPKKDEPTRRVDQLPSFEEVQCLVMWPEGTIGAATETALVRELLVLSERHGLGRLHQIVSAMEEIWRDPKAAEKWKKFKKDHFKRCGFEGEKSGKNDK